MAAGKILKNVISNTAPELKFSNCASEMLTQAIRALGGHMYKGEQAETSHATTYFHLRAPRIFSHACIFILQILIFRVFYVEKVPMIKRKMRRKNRTASGVQESLLLGEDHVVVTVERGGICLNVRPREERPG